MKIFLAAIIFSFFAVFAPSSHGDRPLLHAEPTNGTIKYSDFKLPIARLHVQNKIERLRIAVVHTNGSFFLDTLNPFSLFKSSFKSYDRDGQILSFKVAPLIFDEVLQI